MPASHERVINRPLSGQELLEIIMRDVRDVLNRDGMLGNNIAYGRIGYEVRVSLHMANPVYPEHISTVLSRPASRQQVEAKPELAAIQTPPITVDADPNADVGMAVDEHILSEERHRTIVSPNAARVEHDLPLRVTGKNDNGASVEREIRFTGDKPDPASVGNVTSDRDSAVEQTRTWNELKRKKR